MKNNMNTWEVMRLLDEAITELLEKNHLEDENLDLKFEAYELRSRIIELEEQLDALQDSNS